ncbi:MAG TPA: preprotein translocase subunit YajC [Pilimelia sp.]|nr:preprotein translocase subunit YajC [Pilimelia sp.]
MVNAAASQGGGSLLPLLMIVLLFGLMYFMMIRPQQRRRRQAQEMQSVLGPGDEVVTVGGLYGTVTAIDDETVTLEVSPGVHTRYARQAIAQVRNRAEAPSADSVVDDSKD